MFIAADVYRPAAIDRIRKQLENKLEFMFMKKIQDARVLLKTDLYAKENNFDLVIVDTAGRLHIDEEMMQELVDVKKIANPSEILLTVMR